MTTAPRDFVPGAGSRPDLFRDIGDAILRVQLHAGWRAEQPTMSWTTALGGHKRARGLLFRHGAGPRGTGDNQSGRLPPFRTHTQRVGSKRFVFET